MEIPAQDAYAIQKCELNTRKILTLYCCLVSPAFSIMHISNMRPMVAAVSCLRMSNNRLNTDKIALFLGSNEVSFHSTEESRVRRKVQA